VTPSVCFNTQHATVIGEEADEKAIDLLTMAHLEFCEEKPE